MYFRAAHKLLRTFADPHFLVLTEFDSYPEGATAWIQVAAAGALFASSIGGIYTWGVLQEALVADGVGDASTISWIGSTQATVQAALAILVGRLVAHYGAVSLFLPC